VEETHVLNIWSPLACCQTKGPRHSVNTQAMWNAAGELSFVLRAIGPYHYSRAVGQPLLPRSRIHRLVRRCVPPAHPHAMSPIVAKKAFIRLDGIGLVFAALPVCDVPAPVEAAIANLPVIYTAIVQLCTHTAVSFALALFKSHRPSPNKTTHPSPLRVENDRTILDHVCRLPADDSVPVVDCVCSHCYPVIVEKLQRISMSQAIVKCPNKDEACP